MSVRVLGLAGLISAAITIGASRDTHLLALAGVIMVGANVYALVRGGR